jgi:hypothetical protein
MRTHYLRTVIATGLLVFGVAAGAVAEDKTRLLTSIDVKRLVASAQPADHASLRDHFSALAEKYDREAQRDREFARVLNGHPNRRFGGGVNAKFTRLADSAARSALTLREVAAHHGRLSMGEPSLAPGDGARFEAGEGAPAPTEKQLKELAAGARTVVDHRVLADYYTTLAETNAKAVDKHIVMARNYRASGARSVTPAMHCDSLVKKYREAANAAAAAALEHTEHLSTVG